MSFMKASGLHATIQSKTLAAIVDNYKDEIMEMGFSGAFDSPLFVTVNQEEVTLEKDVLDSELPCPESLDDLVFCLIEMFGDEDIMEDIASQIMDEEVDPDDLDVDEYGTLGELYRELCQSKEAILGDIRMVKWEVNREASEGYESDEGDSNSVFSYDPVNGERFEENDSDGYDEEEED